MKEAMGNSVGTKPKLASKKPITSALGDDTKGVKQKSSASPKGMYFLFKIYDSLSLVKARVYRTVSGQFVLMI